MMFLPGHTYRTRHGENARVLAADLRGAQPVVVAVEDERGREEVWTYHADGTFRCDGVPSGNDLVEADQEQRAAA